MTKKERLRAENAKAVSRWVDEGGARKSASEEEREERETRSRDRASRPTRKRPPRKKE